VTTGPAVIPAVMPVMPPLAAIMLAAVPIALPITLPVPFVTAAVPIALANEVQSRSGGVDSWALQRRGRAGSETRCEEHESSGHCRRESHGYSLQCPLWRMEGRAT
jgi:hypothetical protein